MLRSVVVSAIIVTVPLSVMAGTTASITLGGTAVTNQGVATSRTGVTNFGFDNGGVCDTSLLAAPGTSRVGDVRIEAGSANGVRQSPLGDTSCFLSIGQSKPQTIGYAKLSGATFGASTNYVGFDWGSPDSYNAVSFRDASNQLITFYASGRSLGSTVLTGATLLSAFNITGIGNDVSQFVNFDFSAPVRSMLFYENRNNAFEIDNLAIGSQPGAFSPIRFKAAEIQVAEPTAFGAFALGLAALVGRYRASRRV